MLKRDHWRFTIAPAAGYCVVPVRCTLTRRYDSEFHCFNAMLGGVGRSGQVLKWTWEIYTTGAVYVSHTQDVGSGRCLALHNAAGLSTRVGAVI